MILAAAAIAVTAASTGLATAETGTPRQIEDACGDADSRVSLNDRTQRLEAGDPARDLAGAGFRVLQAASGERSLVVDVESCGQASAASSYLVQIGFEDDCVLDVAYIPRRLNEGVVAPEVRVAENCFDNGGLLPTTGAREVSRTTLPATAATFAGKTLTVTVPIETIKPVTLPRLANGTVWDGSVAVIGDPDVGFFSISGGTSPQPTTAVVVRYDLGRGSGYVVGQDQDVVSNG